MKDDTLVSCSFDQGHGGIIPPVRRIRNIDFGETRWILVIEKEVIACGLPLKCGTGFTDWGPGNFSHSCGLPVLETLRRRSRHYNHSEKTTFNNQYHQAQRLMRLQGKGYPDLATLEFLNLVHSARPLMPILGVFDCDPHGIEIMRIYKYGSLRLRHEENARVPGLRWLGVKMEDVVQACPPAINEDGSQSSLGQSAQSSQSSFGQFSQGSQGSAFLGK